MDKDTSEIVKLTERISKDPKSKLFVPLAEEYKKAGDIEMSIHVLSEGLKHNPGYVTAKSFLGRLLLEKGDLAGSQKEFEEVVKAIPDNLLAQKKLGEIYALQGKSGDALTHYKVALSLNPKDEETASLVADLAAGKPVKERILKPKPPAAPDQTAKPKPAPPSRPTGGTEVPRPAAPLPRPSSAEGEREVPEEVLVVEPLEPAARAGSAIAGGLDFLAERGPQPFQAGEERSPGFTLPGEPYQPAPVEAPALPRGNAGALFTGEGAGTGEAFPAIERAGQDAPRPAESTTDDFTTNTLAELYITQGFYEKAIDIYERMLADNPENRAIQAKLDQVRAMAGPSVPSGGVDLEPGPFVPPVEQASWTEKPESASPAADAFGGFEAPRREEFPQTLPLDAGGGGFEPQEYRPQSEMQPSAASLSPRKKQTIGRLEQWLKNIIKEK
ncbi:MAG: tetratricopeptide repeat protein [Nitrospirota bacterium]